MATAVDTTKVEYPPIRHMEWCGPTADPIRGMRTEVRIEQFYYMADDPKGGRSKPTHRVTRCLECGEERVDAL